MHRKKALQAGLFVSISADSCRGRAVLGHGRIIGLRRSAILGRPILTQNLGRHFLAGAAVRRYSESCLQPPKIRDASLRGLADLLVGDGVADTDVHDFNDL
jgi:hypothetical protein